MIVPQTVLSVLDNTGAKEVRCVQLLGKNYNKFGAVGSLFIGVILSLKISSSKNIFKKGNLVKCLVVQTKKNTGASFVFKTGFYYRSSKNGAVILRDKQKALDLASTRLQMTGSFLLKQKGFFKCYDFSIKNFLMTQLRQQRLKTPDMRITRCLAFIFGIGFQTANSVCKSCGILSSTNVGWLTDRQFLRLTSWLEDKSAQDLLTIDFSLKQAHKKNLAKLVSIRSYRGSRHANGLPSRGQNTKSNSKTSKKRISR